MALFGNNIPKRDIQRLILDNQQLDAELREAKRVIDQRGAALDAATEELRALKSAPAPSLADVLHELKLRVPTLPYMPGYQTLASASDPKSFAQGLHLALLHARRVGQAEGKNA